MNCSLRFGQLLAITALSAALVAHAQMDVDQADSLDFEAFHTHKDAAIKIWESKDDNSKAVTKTFTDEQVKVSGGKPAAVPTSTSTSTTTTMPITTPIATSITTVTPATSSPRDDNHGKRFEIRELYSITGSDRTGYNPNTVVQALFLQMQGLCPNGWRKLDERSVPDGQEFYLHYQFECL